MKKALVLACALLLAVSATSAAELKVGFVATNFAAEAQARVANAFEKIAKEKGWNAQMLNSAGSIDTQSTQLENLLQMKVNAVVLAMAHPLEVRPALEKLFEAKIPVITIDSGYVDGVVVDITSDNFGVGAKMSTYLVDALGGNGNIVLIKFEKHQGSRRRGKVMDAVLSEYPGIKVLAEYSVVATKSFMDDTRSAVETYVTRFGEQIDGVWCAFDQLAYAAGDVLSERLKDKKPIIVAADGNKETFRRIGDGLMSATVAQPFEEMAAVAASLVEKIAVEGKMPEQATQGKKLFYVDTPLYDAANLPKE
ncbi:MAG: sugar ABC transporter substrate-binding protein [Synergistaceae bacterium]|nr:sugar ABC transporter substrate-binding protein [Synergistaceae bacterium]